MQVSHDFDNQVNSYPVETPTFLFVPNSGQYCENIILRSTSNKKPKRSLDQL